MTKIEKEFLRLWRQEQERKQFTVHKKNELEDVARDWFFRGVQYVVEIFGTQLGGKLNAVS